MKHAVKRVLLICLPLVLLSHFSVSVYADDIYYVDNGRGQIQFFKCHGHHSISCGLAASMAQAFAMRA